MALWYYADGDEQRGPVEAIEIERLIGTAQIQRETLVWRDGLDGWESASRHFAQAFANPTPPPVPESAPRINPASTSATAATEQLGPDGLYVGAPSREFVEAAKVCISKYATFSGRASRSEFWFFMLFSYMAAFVAQIVDVAIIAGIAATGVPFFIPIFSIIVVLGLLLPQLAVSWRRLHDIDRTGWWLGGGMIATFIFYVAVIWIAISEEASGGLNGEPPAGLLAALGIFVLGMIAYGITVFIFYVTKGTLGPNRFG